MPDKSLEEVFIDELGDVYDAEKRLIHALPRLIQHADAESLRLELQRLVERSRQHLLRLEGAFDLLGRPARRNGCNAMQGLITESECLVSESSQATVRDAAILAAAQKIGHYTIATYTTLREWAQQLGQCDVSAVLQQSLDESITAGENLSRLALTLDHAAAHAEQAADSPSVC